MKDIPYTREENEDTQKFLWYHKNDNPNHWYGTNEFSYVYIDYYTEETFPSAFDKYTEIELEGKWYIVIEKKIDCNPTNKNEISISLTVIPKK